MRRRRTRATYSLDDARRLISEGKILFGSRARKFLREHYLAEGSRAVAAQVFRAMDTRHFVRSEELDYRPGTFADIYQGMTYDEIEWYVKFFINEDGNEQIEIWTMTWDGVVH